MAIAKYTPLANVTLTSTATTLTFGSIPADYRDLRLVINASGLNDDVLIQFNGDTNTNYSRVYIAGQPSGAVSGTGGTTFISTGYISSNMATVTVDVMDYSTTNKHKTTVARGSDVAVVMAIAGRWASNSAITSMTVYRAGSNAYAAGSTFSLYGVK